MAVFQELLSICPQSGQHCDRLRTQSPIRTALHTTWGYSPQSGQHCTPAGGYRLTCVPRLTQELSMDQAELPWWNITHLVWKYCLSEATVSSRQKPAALQDVQGWKVGNQTHDSFISSTQHPSRILWHWELPSAIGHCRESHQPLLGLAPCHSSTHASSQAHVTALQLH